MASPSYLAWYGLPEQDPYGGEYAEVYTVLSPASGGGVCGCGGCSSCGSVCVGGVGSIGNGGTVRGVVGDGGGIRKVPAIW